MNDVQNPAVVTLNYRELRLAIQFDPSIHRPHSTLGFALRSSIGRELRSMVCYFPRRPCAECKLRDTCAYGVVFYTDKGDGERDVHPYALSLRPHVTLPSLSFFILRLFGPSMERYLPYLYYAVVRAGIRGVSARKGFEIKQVWIDQREIDVSEDAVTIPETRLECTFAVAESAPTRRTVIRMDALSPVRIKAKGRYLGALDWKELWIAAARRTEVLISRYGTVSYDKAYKPTRYSIPEPYYEKGGFEWLDAPYHSRPQETRMQLGGVVGSLEAGVVLDDAHAAVLQALPIMQLGKNTTFGLGDIDLSMEPDEGDLHE
jgi:hypothetical protein